VQLMGADIPPRINPITGFSSWATWAVQGFGDFNGDGTIGNSTISSTIKLPTPFSSHGRAELPVRGRRASIHAPGASDLVLRNIGTGQFEIYGIASNYSRC
jgi:hypothetical protein